MKKNTSHSTLSPVKEILKQLCRFLSQFHQRIFCVLIILSLLFLSSCSRKLPSIQQDLSIHLPSPGIFSWQLDANNSLSEDPQFSPQELLACGAFNTSSRSLSPQQSPEIYTRLAAWRENAPAMAPNLLAIKHRGHLIIGIDSLKQPFSYVKNQPLGLFVKYGRLLNQWLFPQSAPEFIPVHGYKDEAQELSQGNIDIALTPYPLSCDQVHDFSTSMPFYTSNIALAGFTSSPPTFNSTGEVCMDENPLISSITTTFYPHLMPIYSPATEYCQVLQQQGRPLSIVGVQESILSFARQSAMRNLTPVFRIYFSAISQKDNLNLIQLLNLAEIHIGEDISAQEALENTLVTAGVLPNMSSLSQCKHDIQTLKMAIPDENNLSTMIGGIQKNFAIPAQQYLRQACLNPSK